MSQVSRSLRVAFESHPSRWYENVFVYPVISRRSRGLSIGINLNPDQRCNFACIYCQVDRTRPPRTTNVDLPRVESELRSLLAQPEAVFEHESFAGVPPEYRSLRNIAFSGDGEPTRAAEFPEAARLAVRVRDELGLSSTRIVVITNATALREPVVAETLALLYRQNGEIWAKLDAGTEAYFRRVNAAGCTLEHVLENILAAGREQPLVIQSLFMLINGMGPSAAEIAAYAARLSWLLKNGCRISHVQVYTVARRTAQPYVTELHPDELMAIARQVEAVGLPVESFT